MNNFNQLRYREHILLLRYLTLSMSGKELVKNRANSENSLGEGVSARSQEGEGEIEDWVDEDISSLLWKKSGKKVAISTLYCKRGRPSQARVTNKQNLKSSTLRESTSTPHRVTLNKSVNSAQMPVYSSIASLTLLNDLVEKGINQRLTQMKHLTQLWNESLPLTQGNRKSVCVRIP